MKRFIPVVLSLGMLVSFSANAGGILEAVKTAGKVISEGGVKGDVAIGTVEGEANITAESSNQGEATAGLAVIRGGGGNSGGGVSARVAIGTVEKGGEANITARADGQGSDATAGLAVIKGSQGGLVSAQVANGVVKDGGVANITADAKGGGTSNAGLAVIN